MSMAGTFRALFFAIALVGAPLAAAAFEVAPPVDEPFPTIPPPPVSTLSLTLDAPFDALERLAEMSLPPELRGASDIRNDPLSGRVDWRVALDGAIRLGSSGAAVRLDLPVAFRVAFNGGIDAFGYGRIPLFQETEGALTAHLYATPSITREWRIRTQPALDVTWRRPPQLEILGLSFSLEGVATDLFEQRVDSMLSRVDDTLNAQLDVRDRVEALWKHLSRPVHLSMSPDVWLVVEPEEVRLPPLRAERDRVRCSIGVRARLRLVAGDEPEVPEVKPLPPLVVEESGGDGFDVSLAISVPYATLAEQANDALTGKSFSLPGGGSATVESVDVRGSGGKLVVAALVGGSSGDAGAAVRGSIYLVGRPVLDERTQTLSIEDFDFDANTTAGLLQNAAWLAHGALVSFVRERLSFPLGSRLDVGKEMISRALERSNENGPLAISADVRAVSLDGLALSARGVELLFRATGSISATVVPEHAP